MARAADFDLAKELARPSFTPAVRDAAALVDLVTGGDEPAATRAAAALGKLGPPARDAVLAKLGSGGDEPAATRAAAALGKLGAPARDAVVAKLGSGGEQPPATRAMTARGKRSAPARASLEGKLASGDDGGKARLIAVLGQLARSGDHEASSQVIAHTRDPAPRVRKAAAVALGKIGGDEARRALIVRWDAGDATPEERRALAEALGKVGGDETLARLRALDAAEDRELGRRRDRAILMADRSARRDDASTIASDVALPRPIALQLGSRPGLGVLLREELAALGLAAYRAQPAGPAVPAVGASARRPGLTALVGGPAPGLDDRIVEIQLAAPLGSLFAARLWTTAAIPLPLARGDLATAITQTLTSRAALGVLRAWTRGPIRWRLGFAHGHKRAVVWRVARDVTAAAPDLINDPTATTWDVLVDDEAWTLALVPRRLDDPRFAYRVADVPAASHPTVAAALAWVGDARADDRVWDPFCGSGVELIERARRGPVRRLLGTEVDRAALDAARANLDAAGVAAELAIADARSHAPDPVDLIVTNPPLGSRIQLDAAALLVAALPNLARALAPGGRLVWITPSPRKTTPAAEQLGLVRTRSLAVDLGGVRGQLERWDRR